ncbi:MAG: class I SAM-dependent methyltransferase [Deltaproteobacteria bacterium]|nr:class I SAM-dependent methyltransferase [Deltaproteobacteria bacterium]
MIGDTGLVAALSAFAASDVGRASALADQAAAVHPEPLAIAAAAHLRQVVARGSVDVYASPDGFAAFIRAGGNVPLYRETSAAYAEALRQHRALPALDLGTGDGRALLPALEQVSARVVAVEPSAALAGELRARADARTLAVEVLEATAQAITRDPALRSARFGLCASTFALQSLPRADRMQVLGWLRDHCRTLAIAEFDAPDLSPPYADDTLRDLVARYRRGVAEYAACPEPAVSGFLMPVLFGYFAAGRSRTVWEQPVGAWISDLRAAGFLRVRSRPLFPYWWAEAHWITADAP